MTNIRQSHKARLWIIGGLLAIAVALIFIVKGTAAKVVLGVVIALLLGAFGMEASKTDYDMGTLVKTGSLSAAKIERDASGNLTNIDGFCNAEKLDYNCTDFKTQPEAQSVYSRCQELGKNMDIYHLDGDKDGTVCESLPVGASQ
jgi:Excalibur calcium-binding domain